MKRSLKMFLTGFGILALILLVWMALMLSQFVGVSAYEPDSVYSPDGSKVIVPSVNFNKNDSDNFLLVSFEVQQVASGTRLFHVQTKASNRMRWSLSWVDNDLVRLDSSDIGSYCWATMDDNVWSETTCP